MLGNTKISAMKVYFDKICEKNNYKYISVRNFDDSNFNVVCHQNFQFFSMVSPSYQGFYSHLILICRPNIQYLVFLQTSMSYGSKIF